MLLAEYGGSMWLNGNLSLGRREPINEPYGRWHEGGVLTLYKTSLVRITRSAIG
jgi:hypothetical protein